MKRVLNISICNVFYCTSVKSQWGIGSNEHSCRSRTTCGSGTACSINSNVSCHHQGIAAYITKGKKTVLLYINRLCHIQMTTDVANNNLPTKINIGCHYAN